MSAFKINPGNMTLAEMRLAYEKPVQLSLDPRDRKSVV